MKLRSPPRLLDTRSELAPYVRTLKGVTEEISPGLLLEGIASGLAPMVIPAELVESASDEVIGWWQPEPRAVLELSDLHVSRSLQRSMKRFTYTVDQAFELVVSGCMDQKRDHPWITSDFQRAYRQLHLRGAAHSVEVWDSSNVIVGGIFGISVGSCFSGESMFHIRRDASKAALVVLAHTLHRAGYTLFDMQWMTPHLESMGAHSITEADYRSRLEQAKGVARVKISPIEIASLGAVVASDCEAMLVPPRLA